MRRLFIMRKDLHMSTGKLIAQTCHCAEAYWTRMITRNAIKAPSGGFYDVEFFIPTNIFDEYVENSFVKTICEAKSKKHLLKAKQRADEIGMVENIDYGLIYDNCLTELKPEEENGTTLTGIWFKPLSDELAHEISKKYQLYK